MGLPRCNGVTRLENQMSAIIITTPAYIQGNRAESHNRRSKKIRRARPPEFSIRWRRDCPYVDSSRLQAGDAFGGEAKTWSHFAPFWNYRFAENGNKKKIPTRAHEVSQRFRGAIDMRTGSFALGFAAVVLTLISAQCASIGPPSGVDEGAIPVRFTYTDPAAESVCIAGSFNGWSGQAHCMHREGDTWVVGLALPPGRYAYGFVVDGQSWRADPEATLSEDSGFGRLNSILIVE